MFLKKTWKIRRIIQVIGQNGNAGSSHSQGIKIGEGKWKYNSSAMDLIYAITQQEDGNILLKVNMIMIFMAIINSG